MVVFNILVLTAVVAWVAHLRLMQDELDRKITMIEHPFLAEDSEILSAFLGDSDD